jgi:hypothetical protein
MDTSLTERRMARFELRPRSSQQGSQVMSKSQFAVMREAIRVVLRHLDDVPPGEEANVLRASLCACFDEAERWCERPPSDGARDALEKRVLALHVAVTRLSPAPAGHGAVREDGMGIRRRFGAYL